MALRTLNHEIDINVFFLKFERIQVVPRTARLLVISPVAQP